jgi:hypothetical protein
MRTQTAQTFLRGIQTTNSDGNVTFTTIYPGWYQGRATHIHVEVTINAFRKRNRVPGEREQHRSPQWRVCVQGNESDVQSVGRNLFRQLVVGARHADGQHGERIRGNHPGGDLDLMARSKGV